MSLYRRAKQIGRGVEGSIYSPEDEWRSRRRIAAFRLERIRSSEEAKSPISSPDLTLAGVSRSPLLISAQTVHKHKHYRDSGDEDDQN